EPQRHKRGTTKSVKKVCGFQGCDLCNKAATFSFLDKVFRRAHSPPRRAGVSATSKKWIRSDLSRTGWSVRRPFERPAELTTITASRYRARASRITASRYRARASRITASRYRARASRPSAPPLWLRGIFLMAQPLLRLRAIALALRALL